MVTINLDDEFNNLLKIYVNFVKLIEKQINHLVN